MSEKHKCEREKKLNMDSCRHLSDLLLLTSPEPSRTEHDRCGKKSAVPLLKYKARNFYGIFSSIISSKMTKTGPNTKENLQKQEKASRQSPRCKKTRKSPKSEENQHSIAARWLPSCHDGSYLFAKKSEAINLNRICPSQHDVCYHSTMG
ncbi:hypothetical protein QL285_081278 [Trifolium repens]|nr:hypothetical protein QL285_081278 [Trifolium repens]